METTTAPSTTDTSTAPTTTTEATTTTEITTGSTMTSAETTETTSATSAWTSATTGSFNFTAPDNYTSEMTTTTASSTMTSTAGTTTMQSTTQTSAQTSPTTQTQTSPTTARATSGAQTVTTTQTMPSTAPSTVITPQTTSAAQTTMGLTTTQASTTGATTEQPKPTVLPTLPPDYVCYPISSDYYFPDLNTNMTTSNSESVAVVPGPFGFGTGVQLTASEETCLQSQNFYHANDTSCFQNPSNCTSGLSVSIWENVVFNEADRQNRYIVSSGGDKEGMPGVALYHQGVDLHAVVSNGSHYWYLYMNGPVPNNTWSNIGMKWKETEGLEIYIDQERVAKVVYPTKVDSAKPGITPPEIAVGCHVTNNTVRYSNFSNGKFDELAIWMHDLNQTEVKYFLGGYDATGANMSIDDLADIIKTKLDISDPEQNKQAVDMLQKMTENNGAPANSPSPTKGTNTVSSSSSSSSNTILSSRPTSATNSTNGSSTNSSEVETSLSPDSTQSTTTDQEEQDSVLKAEVDKLKTVTDIVKLMTDPDKIKKNMTTDEMGAFQDLLHVVSNMFAEEKEPEWLQLQQNSINGSSTVVEGLQAWAMALAQQATPQKKSKSFHSIKVTDNIVLTTNKLTVQEFIDRKGMIVPDYSDSEWANVPWREGTTRIPLDSIQFQREQFDDIGRAPQSYVYIVNFLFSTYSAIAPLNVNPDTLPSSNMFIDSKVITATMQPSRGLAYSLYTHPCIVTLTHNNKEKTLRKLLFHDESQTIPSIKARFCARWNPSVFPNGGWDSTGCDLYHTGAEYSVCYCDQIGTFAILAQNIQRRMIYPDPMWLWVLKYIFYGLSAVFLLIYMGVIIFSRHLKDQFHIIRLNMSFAALAGMACMFATDYVRGERHECTAVTAVLHYAYVAVGCWLLMESHAIFSAMMHGTIIGKLHAYLLFCWGCPLLCLGFAFLNGFQDYGLEPRCIVSWDDELKWSLFAPNLAFGGVAMVIVVATIMNTSFAAVKKEIIFEDLSSVAWGLLFIVFTFVMDWIFACLAYLDIELMYPDFYPIFQVLNASLGLMIFLFMGLGSKRFRIVLCGGVPDGRHMPLINEKPQDLIEVKPQPKKHPIGPYQG